MKNKQATIPAPWQNEHFEPVGQQVSWNKSKCDKGKHVYEQGGIIYRVGTDYVDLLQRDDTVIRVLTKRIKKMKWVDPNCRNKCLDDIDFDKMCKDRNHKSDCSDCRGSHREFHCDDKFDRIKDPVIPFCDGRIFLRLAGLTDGLNFKIFQHKGCRVVFELSRESCY